MYQDQGQSRKAKALRELLRAKGLEIGHAQCLEMLARLDGHRTLHVAHAKTREVVLNELAEEQAQATMFASLGAYKGRFPDLLVELHRVATLRDVFAASEVVQAVFKGSDPVILETAYEELPKYKLVQVYERLVDKLRTVALQKAQAVEAHEQVLFRGRVRDWEEEEGVLDSTEAPRPQYELTITRTGSQFYIALIAAGTPAKELAGTPQLGMFLEVNNGKPCVHITNDIWGDQVLTVFGLRSGLYLRPDSSDCSIRTGFPTEGTDLSEHFEWERRDAHGRRYAWNHAFIESSNDD